MSDTNNELEKILLTFILNYSRSETESVSRATQAIEKYVAHQQAISELKGRTKEIEYLKESHEQNYKANPSEGGKFILGWELKVFKTRKAELEAQLKKLEGKK